MKNNYLFTFISLLILSSCVSPDAENERAEISNSKEIDIEIKGTLVLELDSQTSSGLLMRGNIAYFNEPNKFRISIADLSEGFMVTHRFQYDMNDVQFKFETGTGPFTLFSTPILFRENKLYFTANLFEGKFQTMEDLKVDETYKINSA